MWGLKINGNGNFSSPCNIQADKWLLEGVRHQWLAILLSAARVFDCHRRSVWHCMLIGGRGTLWPVRCPGGELNPALSLLVHQGQTTVIVSSLEIFIHRIWISLQAGVLKIAKTVNLWMELEKRPPFITKWKWTDGHVSRHSLIPHLYQKLH